MIDDEKNSTHDCPTNGMENQASRNVECGDQLTKVQTQLAYLRADFENYRRNIEKERALWMANAQGRVLTDLLVIVDNVERALKDLEAGNLSEQEVARFKGVELIYRELLALLKRYEVTEIVAEGSFDPALHEALAQIEGAGKSAGTIVEVVQRGYCQRGAVLRPAKVIVAR